MTTTSLFIFILANLKVLFPEPTADLIPPHTKDDMRMYDCATRTRLLVMPFGLTPHPTFAVSAIAADWQLAFL
jgi:hypothetical protein